MTVANISKIPVGGLRWRFDGDQLPFQTTLEVDPANEVFGQATAEDALLFGLQCDAPGQNIYVRGTRGTGRQLMVRRLLKKLDLQTDRKRDRCYVQNFKRPDRPRLLALPPGTAGRLQEHVKELAEFIQNELSKGLEAEPISTARQTLKDDVQKRVQAISEPLEKQVTENGMTLASVQQGNVSVPMILPVVEGQTIPIEQFRAMAKKGQIPEERIQQFDSLLPEFRKQLQVIARRIAEVFRDGNRQLEEFNQKAARDLLADLTQQILTSFPGSGVSEFIDEIIDDAVRYRLPHLNDEDAIDLTELYGVNIVLQHDHPTSRPWWKN